MAHNHAHLRMERHSSAGRMSVAMRQNKEAPVHLEAGRPRKSTGDTDQIRVQMKGSMDAFTNLVTQKKEAQAKNDLDIDEIQRQQSEENPEDDDDTDRDMDGIPLMDLGSVLDIAAEFAEADDESTEPLSGQALEVYTYALRCILVPLCSQWKIVKGKVTKATYVKSQVATTVKKVHRIATTPLRGALGIAKLLANVGGKKSKKAARAKARQKRDAERRKDNLGLEHKIEEVDTSAVEDGGDAKIQAAAVEDVDLDDQFLLTYLMKAFRCPMDQHRRLVAEARQYKREHMLLELNTRLLSVDAHPYYGMAAFTSDAGFDDWKSRETDYLKDMIEYVSTENAKRPEMILPVAGALHIRVVQGRNLSDEKVHGKNKHASTESNRNSRMPAQDVETMVLEVFENERRTLDKPYSSNNLMRAERGHFSMPDPAATHGRKHISYTSLDEVLPPGPSWRFVGEWQLDTRRHVDDEGWEYAFNWFHDFEAASPTAFVRRRRWIRTLAMGGQHLTDDEILLDQAEVLDGQSLYCHVTYKHQEFNTQVCDTVPPRWDREYTFDLLIPDTTKGTKDDHRLRLEMWNKGRFGREDFVGQIKVPYTLLTDAIGEEPLVKWFPLQKGKRFSKRQGSITGEVQLSFLFTPFQPPDPERPLPVHHYLYSYLLRETRKFDCKPKPTQRQTSGRLALIEDEREEESTTLSATAQFLLHEYGVRYGVSEVYRVSEYLDILVQNFTVSDEHMKELYVTLMRLFRLTTEDGVALTKYETENFGRCVIELDKKLTDAFVNYKTRFPPNPHGVALNMSLKIFTLLSGTGQFEELYEEYESIEDVVQDLLQAAVMANYESIAAEARRIGDAAAFVEVCDEILKEVKVDAGKYARPFRVQTEVSLAHVSIMCYHSMLILDLHHVLAAQDPNDVNTDIFQLYFKLGEMNRNMSALLKTFKPISVTSLFFPFVVAWLQQASDRLKKWGEQALLLDDFEPVGELPSHSSSVVDIFQSCAQVLDFFINLDWPTGSTPEEDNEALANVLVETLTSVVFDYFCALERRFKASLDELTGHKDEEEEEEKPFFSNPFAKNHDPYETQELFMWFQGLFTDEPDFEATPLLCILFCDMSMCLTQIDDFTDTLRGALDAHDPLAVAVDDLDLTVREYARDSPPGRLAAFHRVIKSRFEVVIQSLCDAMRPTMTHCLRHMYVEASDEANERMRDEGHEHCEDFGMEHNSLLDFMDCQLTVFADNLYFSVFRKVLRVLWKTVCQEYELLVLNVARKKKPTTGALLLFTQLIDPLQDFFHADGEGLPLDYLAQESSTLRVITLLVPAPTSKLIEMCKVLTDANNDEIDAANREKSCTPKHILRVLTTRREDDEAVAYVDHFHAHNPGFQ